MRMHSKEVSKKEIEIISLLSDLNLLNCTLIFKVEGYSLKEFEGCHIGRTQWDILKMYKEIIYPFHDVKTDRYSPGVYSFMRVESSSINNSNYLEYLLKEIEVLLKLICVDSTTWLRRNIFESARKYIEGLINDDIEIKDFSLLHGDLYNGNVLIRNNKYALIDFEYIRFGPPLLEWSFLLFWDLIVNDNLCIRKVIVNKVLSEIEILINNNILTKLDIVLVCDLYLPVILGFSLHNAINNRYDNSKTVINGIDYFWKYEYELIRNRGWRC